MWEITVYPNWIRGVRMPINWDAVIAVLSTAGYSYIVHEEFNSVEVDGYYGHAVELINELGYATDEDMIEDID